MRLTKIKDCKNCANCIISGAGLEIEVQCQASNREYIDYFNENGRYCAGGCKGYVEGTGEKSGVLFIDKALAFMLSGKAEFILHSTKTNEDFHYILTKETSKMENVDVIYFINVIKGHENVYAGFLFLNKETNEFEFKQGSKGKLTKDGLSIRSLIFVINKLNKQCAVGNLEMYHCNKCGCCGQSLNNLDTSSYGLCKMCYKKVYGKDALSKPSI